MKAFVFFWKVLLLLCFCNVPFFNLSFRSLYIMLDSLSYWDPCTSAVGRAWLNQVLQRHDIARVLEPLLLLLLHPKTHRISIQRVQSQQHLTHVFPEPPEQGPAQPIYTRDSGFSDSEFPGSNSIILNSTNNHSNVLMPVPHLFFRYQSNPWGVQGE